MVIRERQVGASRTSSYILFLVIAAAPLPFGSRDPTTVAAWCFLLGLALLFAAPYGLRAGQLGILAGIGFVAGCYGFVLHEQLSDRPWIAQPDAIWDKTAELLGKPIGPSVSIVRGEPFYAIGKSLAPILALILGLLVGADNARARKALFVMGWSGVAYAIYGLVTIKSGGLTATFENRNTAAPYFGACAVVWLVFLLSTVRSQLPAGPIKLQEILHNFYAGSSKEKELALRVCALFICLAAMFMTSSRAGILVSLLGMLIAFLVFFRRDLPNGISLVLALVGSGAVISLLFFLMGGHLQGRIDTAGLADSGRYSAYRSTLRIIAEHPWFGTGWGTFAFSFPGYRTDDVTIWGVWELAHSTPLELAAELGLPLALVVVIAWLGAVCILSYGTRRSRRETIAPVVALAVVCIANLHSSVDFSLQVPGFAIVVFAIAGVGLSQSFKPRNMNVRRRREGHTDEKAEN